MKNPECGLRDSTNTLNPFNSRMSTTLYSGVMNRECSSQDIKYLQLGKPSFR